MDENSYEEYKRNFSREQKKHEGFRNGKFRLAGGIFLLLFTLYILPFQNTNISTVHGSEVAAGKTYDREKVYYIENLQLLCMDKNADDGKVYCIARFSDCDRKDWIICFTPGRNRLLASQVRAADFPENGPGLTVSGYFLMEYLEDLPFEADAFHSVYGREYADAEGRNLLSFNAEYLCAENESPVLKTLLQPGIPLAGLVFGMFGTISGTISLIRNRTHKKPEAGKQDSYPA